MRCRGSTGPGKKARPFWSSQITFQLSWNNSIHRPGSEVVITPHSKGALLLTYQSQLNKSPAFNVSSQSSSSFISVVPRPSDQYWPQTVSHSWQPVRWLATVVTFMSQLGKKLFLAPLAKRHQLNIGFWFDWQRFKWSNKFSFLNEGGVMSSQILAPLVRDN